MVARHERVSRAVETYIRAAREPDASSRAQGLAECFAHDGRLVVHGGQTLVGLDSVLRMFDRFAANPNVAGVRVLAQEVRETTFYFRYVTDFADGTSQESFDVGVLDDAGRISLLIVYPTHVANASIVGTSSPSVRRGDLHWLTLAHPDSTAPGQPHPYVVVQDDLCNDSRIATVVVCGLTTDLRRATEPGNVRLEPSEGGLPQPSVVVVSLIASVEKARLGARIGALSEARVEQILDGLRFQQRSSAREP